MLMATWLKLGLRLDMGNHQHLSWELAGDELFHRVLY
jgi:hypothetical protein